MVYDNRQDSGRRLGHLLCRFRHEVVVVLALPRGGVVIGAEVARMLLAPLGLVLVRKVGHPGNPEYAIGAIAEDGPAVYNENEVSLVDAAWLKHAEAAARKLIADRRKIYYGSDFTPPTIEDKTIIIVDDGIATGLTMEAALRAVRLHHPRKIIAAAPVAPQDSIDMLAELADEIVIADSPKHFLGSVGAHYRQFEQVDDEEVKKLLREVQDELL